jgi:hypothetical protein
MRTYPFKYMKWIILLAFIIFWPLIASAAEEPYSSGNVYLLEKYDFNKGNFSIAGIVWHDQRHNLQKSLGNIYTDDVEVLNILKTNWITENPSPFYACGYHFGIFVIEGHTERESFFINVEKDCNTVVTKNGQFYFDPNKLVMFKDKYKKLVTKRKHFNSCQEGRNYMKALQTKDKLLFYLQPEWFNYDGEFRFSIKCDETDFDSPLAQKCIERAQSRIAERFPGKSFNLEQFGSSNKEILITMKCQRDLYNEFDLYKIEWKYNGYSPDLTVFFK